MGGSEKFHPGNQSSCPMGYITLLRDLLKPKRRVIFFKPKEVALLPKLNQFNHMLQS